MLGGMGGEDGELEEGYESDCGGRVMRVVVEDEEAEIVRGKRDMPGGGGGGGGGGEMNVEDGNDDDDKRRKNGE